MPAKYWNFMESLLVISGLLGRTVACGPSVRAEPGRTLPAIQLVRLHDSPVTLPSRACVRALARRALGKHDRKPGAMAKLALDGHPPPVAGDDMLDDRQPQPGSPLVAAFGHVDAIEPLGEPRQVLG